MGYARYIQLLLLVYCIPVCLQTILVFRIKLMFQVVVKKDNCANLLVSGGKS